MKLSESSVNFLLLFLLPLCVYLLISSFFHYNRVIIAIGMPQQEIHVENLKTIHDLFVFLSSIPHSFSSCTCTRTVYFHEKVRKSFRTSLSPHSITDCVVTLSIYFDVFMPGFPLPIRIHLNSHISNETYVCIYNGNGTRQHRVKIIIISSIVAAVVVVVVVVVRRNVISFMCVCV